MGTQFFAAQLFDGVRWHRNQYLSVDDRGDIEALVPVDAPSDGMVILDGPVVPGMPNLHSHAFQRAMSGLAEHRSASREDFWSWRDVMYRIASTIDPDRLQGIAEQLYLEMLESGYTSVCEFHYLHGSASGGSYADPAEMSRRLLAAAERVGIGITLLPVLYQRGGFDGVPLQGAQRRYGMSHDAYLDLLVSLQDGSNENARVGACFHSLRAVPGEVISLVLEHLPDPTCPIHIHIAEQSLEVEQCLAHHGARPVEWLLGEFEVDRRWCLVHATHVEAAELQGMTDRNVVAGLCPTTEANLGDGLFPLPAYLGVDGAFGVGSDSHVSVSPVEELRWLEYGQRLVQQRRILSLKHPEAHCGASLWSRAVRGGAQASGRKLVGLAAGQRGDWLVLDGESTALWGKQEHLLLDSLVFSGNRNLVKEVYVGGRRRVAAGCHPLRSETAERFKAILDAMI